MQNKVLTIFKIIVILLFIIALGVGGWAAITYFRQKGGGGTDTKSAKIVWWGLWEKKENVQPLIDAYTAQHPNITIEYVEKNDTEYKAILKEKLVDNDPSTSPDIFIVHNTWTTEFDNYMADLPSNVINANDYSTIFYPTFSQDFTNIEGNLKAIPLMYDGIGLFYNKDLLEQKGYSAPPATWTKFVEMAKNLTRRDDQGNMVVAGASLGSAENVEFYFEILSLLMMQEGADMVDSTSNQATFGDDTAAAEALKFYMEFSTLHKTWDTNLAVDVKWFAEGRLAMYFAPSWRAHNIMEANSNLDFAIAPVPQIPSVGNESINYSDYWAYGVAYDSPNQTVAWDFLKFASESAQLQTFYDACQLEVLDSGTNLTRKFGEIFPRKDMVTTDLEEDPFVGAFLTMAPTARTWRMVDKDKVASIFKDVIISLENKDIDVGVAQGKLSNAQDLVNQVIAP